MSTGTPLGSGSGEKPEGETSVRRKRPEGILGNSVHKKEGGTEASVEVAHAAEMGSSTTARAGKEPSEQSSADRWSRRNILVGGLGLLTAGLTGGAAWYFSARSDQRDETAARREAEKHQREFPAPVGDGIKVLDAHAGEFVPIWAQAFTSAETFDLSDLPTGGNRQDAYKKFFERGGCWYGRMSVDVTIESLRRTVLIDGAHVTVRSLGQPPTATIFMPAGVGGPGEETEILHAGINLDAQIPAVRVLSPDMHSASSLQEQADVKNDPIKLLGPFPGKQITLGPHDVKQMRILAEARTGCYEWEFSLDILADGERQSIPIKVTNFPLRIAAPVNDYKRALHETGGGSYKSLGTVKVVSMEELRRWIP